jgi:hypothetical protein
MSAKEELIAAALAQCDVIAGMLGYEPSSLRDMRELCARAMVQPNMAEVERLVSEHEYKLECYHSGIVWAGETKATRTALLDYVRGIMAERDALMQTLRDEIGENLRLRELGGALPDENITAMTERLILERDQFRDAAKMVDVPEIRFGNMLDCRTCAHFTSDGCHSTAVCIDAQQHKATSPRQYWTAAPQPVGAAEVPMQCGWYQDGDEESTTWQTSCGAYFTLNEGTPSDNRFSFCYSCGKHIVEYPIDEDAALRGEVKP